MRILNILHRSVPISRYGPEVAVPPALDTSIVAVVTDQRVGSEPLIGFGFASIGRFAQGGLIGDRFAPRLLRANPCALMHSDGVAIDPLKAWSIMMAGEKAGGQGERSVAVGVLDMAIWDLAAKAREVPLFQLIRQVFGRPATRDRVPVYAGGGYVFPNNEFACLRDEALRFRAMGVQAMKMKVGTCDLAFDCKRLETVLEVFGAGDSLAVDAMNAYSPRRAHEADTALEPYQLKWFEDVCDPLDFETHRRLAAFYRPPISAGEAIFSASDARNLLRYAGLRKGHDVLTFDPAHCYGVPQYARIIELFEEEGWTTGDFQPHGGHLYSLHLAIGLGLGGSECNPHNFQPFGGFADGAKIVDGEAAPPDIPGIGFESRNSLMDLFRSLVRS
jgi:L-alanine-DL-glutamate epimerase-like enolase superfamily enzyme